MEMSENINELATALSLAQAEINNPAKNAANPFFKSKYSDLAEVLGVVRPALSAHGLAVMQHPSIEGGIVTVTTIITHSSGQWAKSAISAAAGKNIQESGSAITYCRRYALSAIAGVSQEDDDGNGATRGKKTDAPVVEGKASAINDDQALVIKEEIASRVVDVKKLLMFAGADSISSIPQSKYDGIMGVLLGKPLKVAA